MAVSLKDLRKIKATLPPRLVIYGPHGEGKTTLASEFPNPVFVQTEQGETSDLELDSFGLLTSFDDVIGGLASLYADAHEFDTVVVDSLDRLEPLVWAATCKAHNWRSIEDPGYGKGYLAADALWRDFLEGLNALRRERNMAIVLIAHSEIGRFDDPRSASYSRYDIRLHKRAHALVLDEVDGIFLLNKEASVKTEEVGFNKTRNHAEGGTQRWIYTEGRPAFEAKNRFGMPAKLAYKLGHGFEALAPFFPSGAPDVPGETVIESAEPLAA